MPERHDEESSDAQEMLDHFRAARRAFIAGLPLPPPAEIADGIERLGYLGQDEQRRALALMAYRHVRRLKRIHVEGTPARDLPPKQNVLMIGPTGCGKTYLVEQGGVRVSRERRMRADDEVTLAAGQELLVQVGKRRFLRVRAT